MEDDPFGFHLRGAPLENMLVELEVGNAVTHEPARLGVFLEDMDLMPGARQLLSGGEA